MAPDPLPPHGGHPRSQRLGQVLGDYLVQEELGRGTMGVVYLAHHVQTGQPCAVKLMNPVFAEDPTAVQRFLRECRTLQQLGDHPGIVQVHGSGTVNGRPFFAMELVGGPTWEDRLKIGQSSDEALETLAQVAEAVCFLHHQDVVHRDLKPENVLLAEDGTPRLMDFGLAWLGDASTTRLTLSQEILGTPYYMAPEQCDKSRGEVSPKSDVHALGVMLYRALTGELPYQGQTSLEVYTKVLSSEPQIPSDLPGPLQALLKDALAKAPSARPTAQEFVDRLSASSGEGGGGVSTKLLVGLLLLGLVGVGLGVFAYLTRKDSAQQEDASAELADDAPLADRACVAAWAGDFAGAQAALDTLEGAAPGQARALRWELVGYGLPAPSPSKNEALEKTLLDGWDLVAAGFELIGRGLPELALPALEEAAGRPNADPELLDAAARGVARARLEQQVWGPAERAAAEAKGTKASPVQLAHAEGLEAVARALRAGEPVAATGLAQRVAESALRPDPQGFDEQLAALRRPSSTIAQALLARALGYVEVADRVNERRFGFKALELAERLNAVRPEDPRALYVRALARLVTFSDDERPPHIDTGEPVEDLEQRQRTEAALGALEADLARVKQLSGASLALAWLEARVVQARAECLGLRAEGSHATLLDEAASPQWLAGQALRHVAAQAAYRDADAAWTALSDRPAPWGQVARLAAARCGLEALAHRAWSEARSLEPLEAQGVRELLAPQLADLEVERIVDLRRRMAEGDEQAERALCALARDVDPLACEALYLLARCGDAAAARAYLGLVADAPARAFLALRRGQLPRARQLGGPEVALLIPGEGVDSASVASALQAHPELITFAVERVEGEAEAVSLASALCALQGSRDVKRQERARRSAAVQAALVSQELVRGGEPAALGIRALALDALGVPDPNLALALEVAPCSELWKLELARWSEGGASQAVAARAQWDRALASGTLSTAPPQAELKRVARALGAEGPLQELRLREGFMEAAKESSRDGHDERRGFAHAWGEAVAPRTAWSALAAICFYRRLAGGPWRQLSEVGEFSAGLTSGVPPEEASLVELGQLALEWRRSYRVSLLRVPLYRAAVRARYRLAVAGDPLREGAALRPALPFEALAPQGDALRGDALRVLRGASLPHWLVGDRRHVDFELPGAILQDADLVRAWGRSRAILEGATEGWLQPMVASLLGDAADSVDARLAQDRALAFGAWPWVIHELSDVFLSDLDTLALQERTQRLERLTEVHARCGYLLEVLEHEEGREVELERYRLRRLRIRALLDSIGTDPIHALRKDWSEGLRREDRASRRPVSLKQPLDWELWDDVRRLAVSGRGAEAAGLLERIQSVSRARLEHDPLLPDVRQLAGWGAFEARMRAKLGEEAAAPEGDGHEKSGGSE
ncbi:MAG: protein kinase [Planctomycetes bacterium]|nr:protein kinase [Planctomycetota bacterium]